VQARPVRRPVRRPVTAIAACGRCVAAAPSRRCVGLDGGCCEHLWRRNYFVSISGKGGQGTQHECEQTYQQQEQQVPRGCPSSANI